MGNITEGHTYMEQVTEPHNKFLEVFQTKMEPEKRTQIVGVVGDIRRDMEGHHYAEKCSVFGINATELAALQRHGIVTRPREFNPTSDRFQALASPFRVMKLLSEYFGYTVDNCPIEGRVNSEAGERRTCIYTLQSHSQQ